MELRLLIWEHAILDQYRFLKFRIQADKPNGDEDETGPSPYSTTNRLGRTISGSQYTVILEMASRDGGKIPNLISPLFSVNRESRRVALDKYRLQIPCSLVVSCFVPCLYSDGIHSCGTKVNRRLTLYLNPDRDFVLLSSKNGFRGSVLVGRDHNILDFLHDVRANDPRGQGITNLALECENVRRMCGLSGLSDERSWVDPGSHLHPDERTRSLTDTLSRLQNIIWMTTVLDRFGGRGTDCIAFNRAMPIMPELPFCFSLLERDSRQPTMFPHLANAWNLAEEEQSLSTTIFYRNWLLKVAKSLHLHVPRRMEDKEGQGEEARNVVGGVDKIWQAEEHVLLGCESLSGRCRVYDTVTANKFLKGEEQLWEAMRKAENDENDISENGKDDNSGCEDELPKPAVGFWLCRYDEADKVTKQKDLTGYWPQLALAHLG